VLYILNCYYRSCFFFLSKILSERNYSCYFLFIFLNDLLDFNVSGLSCFKSKNWCFSFLSKELRRFLMLFSVLPLRILDKSDHFFPIFCSDMMSVRSSSNFHSDLLRFGSRWLFHLSRHCFPCLKIYEFVIRFNS